MGKNRFVVYSLKYYIEQPWRLIPVPITALHTPNFTVRYEKRQIFPTLIKIRESRENKKVVKIFAFTVFKFQVS